MAKYEVCSQNGMTKEEIEKLKKEGFIITNIPTKKEDEGDVLCKMAVKGKCSKLKGVLDSVIDSYYSSPRTVNSKWQPEINPELKITLMIEKVKESQ